MSARDKCEVVRPLLSVYIDGETSAAESALVEAHLDTCSGCASDLAFLRMTHAALADVIDIPPPVALRERIAMATYARPTLSQRIAAFLRPAPMRLALGTALAVGVVAVIVARQPMGPATPVAGTLKPATVPPGPVAEQPEGIEPGVGSDVATPKDDRATGAPKSAVEPGKTTPAPSGVSKPPAVEVNRGRKENVKPIESVVIAERPKPGTPRTGAMGKTGGAAQVADLKPMISSGHGVRPGQPTAMGEGRMEYPVPGPDNGAVMPPDNGRPVPPEEVRQPNVVPPPAVGPPPPASTTMVSHRIESSGRIRIQPGQPNVDSEIIAFNRTAKGNARTPSKSYYEFGQGGGGIANLVDAPGTL